MEGQDEKRHILEHFVLTWRSENGAAWRQTAHLRPREHGIWGEGLPVSSALALTNDCHM